MEKTFRNVMVFCILLLSIFFSSCSSQVDTAPAPTKDNVKADTVQENTNAPSLIKVHFIDVGQADSIFIQLSDGKTILMDGGNRGDAEVIDKYLQSLNIKTIDYLLATHPHEDHIGSLPEIVKNYEIGSVYMPKTTANTKVFEELLLTIKAKGLKINTAAGGLKLIDTKDTKLTLLAPNSSSYDEINEYSIVAKLVYKNTSFLLTGDAEAVSEGEILKGNYDIKSDLLKVGHHGGRTSTGKEFLEQVAPKYAVISVGKENDYGHPHKETMERLSSSGIQIYRTDELGIIIASSDGSSILMNQKPSMQAINVPAASKQYIGNKNSKVFHLSSCSSLPKAENQVRLEDREKAIVEGYRPCQICKP